MTSKYFLATALFITAMMTACETVINPNLEPSAPLLVVDAWLTNQSKEQVIKLTQSQPYFENTKPPGVSSAIVTVTNETNGRTFIFNEEGTTGKYIWLPSSPTDSIGKTGDGFSLLVTADKDTYVASSVMGRVPKIDSITFSFDKATGFFPDLYTAEFWATDPKGSGDTYWIKAWKNDTLLLKPSEINIAFDAGFFRRRKY